MTAKNILKEWFSNLKKPTQAHFWAWLDSYWHKSEAIPMQNIQNLDKILQETATATQFENLSKEVEEQKVLLDTKVDKEQGKVLSTNDFTTELKEKLERLEEVFLKKETFSIFKINTDKSILQRELREIDPITFPKIKSDEKGRFLFENTSFTEGFLGIVIETTLLDNYLNFIQLGLQTYPIFQVFDFMVYSPIQEDKIILTSKYPIKFLTNKFILF